MNKKFFKKVNGSDVTKRNDGDEANGSGSYEQSMVLQKKKNSGGDNAANFCVMRRMYV